MNAPTVPRADRRALGAAVFCYTFWGLMPLLFQAAAWAGAGPWEIAAWRTVWAVPCVLLLVAASRKLDGLRRLPPRVLAWLCLSALLIGINWVLYVWAVNTGRTLEVSLAYYVGPLMSMAAGMLLFRERIDRAGLAAIGLAAAGVTIQSIAIGGLPWASLVLAAVFAGYGVIRKRVAADAQTGLAVECLILAVPATAWLFWAGPGVFGATAAATALLMAGGLATVAPLAAFAYAARRLPLTQIGFMQYIAPTLVFIIGMLQHDAISPLTLLAFALIWAGVAVYAVNAWRGSQATA